MEAEKAIVRFLPLSKGWQLCVCVCLHLQLFEQNLSRNKKKDIEKNQRLNSSIDTLGGDSLLVFGCVCRPTDLSLSDFG